MHELGIVFHIMDSVEAVARENHIQKVQSVTLEIGEVSAVLPDYLTDCWNWAIRKKPELLGECRMEIETIHAITHCDGCGQDYGTVEHGKRCPLCGSEKTWLVTGNEVNIKEITVLEE